MDVNGFLTGLFGKQGRDIDSIGFFIDDKESNFRKLIDDNKKYKQEIIQHQKVNTEDIKTTSKVVSEEQSKNNSKSFEDIKTNILDLLIENKNSTIIILNNIIKEIEVVIKLNIFDLINNINYIFKFIIAIIIIQTTNFFYNIFKNNKEKPILENRIENEEKENNKIYEKLIIENNKEINLLKNNNEKEKEETQRLLKEKKLIEEKYEKLLEKSNKDVNHLKKNKSNCEILIKNAFLIKFDNIEFKNIIYDGINQVFNCKINDIEYAIKKYKKNRKKNYQRIYIIIKLFM
jgi:hypothetical protein